ncbi:MAG: D-glycero-beta-D-manno-heptose-7-phosphate kinase [Gemmatimonadetes bacterium]|nr:D-glycero-beta-D-manno-heptose-7-phosphate kinase [Gemmatimonadota bacterium]
MTTPGLKSALTGAIAGLGGRRVVVLGDVMLDRYLWGDARRISPEAPVPVVELHDGMVCPGGAANVAANIMALGGRADVIGTVGADEDGRELTQQLASRGIGTDGLLVLGNRPTTSKTRVIAGGQQVLRFDREIPAPVTEAEADALASNAKALIAIADAVVISDYAKGVITQAVTGQVICAARERDLPVITGPKGRELGKYDRSSIIIANRLEAGAISGLEVTDEETAGMVAGQFFERLACPTVIITRGEQGLSVFQRGAEPVHLRALSRQVYDVTGAGDTVVATVALGLAAGASVVKCAALANIAAGVVVGKAGTAVVTAPELRAALRRVPEPEYGRWTELDSSWTGEVRRMARSVRRG